MNIPIRLFSLTTTQPYVHFRLAKSTLSVSDGDIVFSELTGSSYPDFQITITATDYKDIKKKIHDLSLTEMFLRNIDDDEMTLVSGAHFFTIGITKAVSEWGVALPGLRSLKSGINFIGIQQAKECAGYMSNDPHREMLCGVKVGNGFMYATNGYSLFKTPISLDHELSFFLNSRQVKCLSRMSRALFLDLDGHCYISDFKTTIIIDKNSNDVLAFPEVDHIINQHSEDKEHKIGKTIRGILTKAAKSNVRVHLELKDQQYTITVDDEKVFRFKSNHSESFSFKTDMKYISTDHAERITHVCPLTSKGELGQTSLFRLTNDRTIVVATYR